MNKFFTSAKAFTTNFAKEEDGAQVVEYALIIALVSIVLAGALADDTTGIKFSELVTRVTNCFKGTCT